MKLFSLLAEVLYIGHSLVGPDLPNVVAGGLRAMQDPATVVAQIINGAPLRFNFENSASAEGVDGRVTLQEGKTDVLILTEAIPLAEHLRWNDTPGEIVRFADLARLMNPDVRVFLYETWHSRASGPGTEIAGDPNAGMPWRERLEADLPLWEGAVAEANRRLGEERVQLLPAGQAMARLADAVAAGEVPGVSSMDAFFSDDIHLTERGQYFVALVHVAAITGRSPEGLPAQITRAWRTRDGVVGPDLAAVLQRIAWEAVSSYRPVAGDQAALMPSDAAPAPEPVVPSMAPIQDMPDLASLTPITNPNLALGLNGLSDWSVQQPFLDVIKTAREWTGHLPGQFGGWDHDDLAAAGVLDAQGWPMRIPEQVTGLSLLVLTDLPEDAAGVAGRYLVTWEGRGRIVVEGRGQVVEEAPGRIVLDYAPGPRTVSLTLSETDPADPLRNITMVREDRASLLAAGQVFNPDWLARIRGAKTLRFMDWMATNDSTLAQAEERPRPEHYTWTRDGAPIEVMVALANELDANPWFTMPHLAEDALIRAYAEAVRDGLEPGLNAHVEFSNEVWNWQFAQAEWAEAQGRARWGGESKWVQFYALRAAEMARIWAEVFGAEAEARLTPVIATQTGWIGLEDQILSAPDVMAEGLPAPANVFDAYAVTGYFSGLLGSAEKAPMVRGWLDASEAAAQAEAAALGLQGAEAEAHVAAHRFDEAVQRAVEEIADGRHSGDRADTLARLLEEVLPHHAQVAARHGLILVMYEGGTHVVGFGAEVEDARLTAFFTHLNYTPEMAALYDRLLQGWAKLTPEPFNAFVDVSAPGKWGSWGALRHLGDDNPRWQVLAKGCLAC